MMEESLKRLAEAACAVYRVADRLPADDPIVRFLKDAALTAAESCTVSFYAPEAYNENKAHGDIATLCGYFVVAREQNWIDARNFDILLSEYQTIKEELKSPIGTPGYPIAAQSNNKNNGPIPLSQRQKKILEYIKDRGAEEVSLKDLRKLFSDITPRTVQRDLQVLLDNELITKEGTTHNTTYRLNA